MASPLDEQTFGFAEAARMLPSGRGGRPIAPQTLARWASTGTKGPDGQRRRLQAWRLGGRWVTSREAIERFMLALTPGSDDDTPEPTPRARRRDREHAARVLDAAGIA